MNANVPPVAPVIVTLGPTVSTVHAWFAGAPVMPPAVARTRTWCGPSGSPDSTTGDEHGVNDASSSEHSNVAPATSAENVSVASGWRWATPAR